MKRIYLDNAATTRVDPEVVKAMEKYELEEYGVASSEFGNSFGVKARNAIEDARAIIAKRINAGPKEIIFTSGSTEGNNIAIQGVASAKGCSHLITSKVEHQSVLNVFKFFEKKRGCSVTYLDVDKEGFIDLNQLKKSITDKTALVSIAHANHEIGTIQNIAAIGKMCREKGLLFHTDASHSFLRNPIDVKAMNIDLLTIAADLIHGPKGVGALYARDGIRIDPIIFGGYQEKGLRPGTEDIPGIVGFGKAVEIFDEKENKGMAGLRDRLIEGLLKVEETRLNGPRGGKRLCNNVNITFRYVEGESLLLHLDMRGIAVTTGSACFSQELMPSHVIMALGLTHGDAHGSMRLSLSKYNTQEEMDYTIKQIKKVVEKLREISPLTEIKGGK
ncbi:MAG: cysteine desulfurase [Candidatus Altiarchaeota archaeon]|nr:cysteine desulfurase [Candidatus Altiarchaeota archaeon]